MRFVVAIFCAGFGLSPPASACGQETECPIGDRHYRIYMPESVGSDPTGAIVFAHGFRGSDQGTMRNQNLLAMADDLGVALIALKSAGDDWALPLSPRDYDSDGHAEEEYVESVLRDAAARFPIDRQNIVMTGFSAGGMVTWHMACHRPDLFAGFIPMSGTFWLRTPETCEVPLKPLVHLHGTTDEVVPLQGRPIRDTHQGNVFEALDLYRRDGGFGPEAAASFNDLSCKVRHNAQLVPLVFCLFDGGHRFRTQNLVYAWSIVVGETEL